jgi:anti-sigma-K factor RskA
VAAAAAVALIGGGVIATQPWADDQSTEQRLSAADRVLGDPAAQHVTQEFPDGATATVVRSRQEDTAVLVTANMPPPPDGKVYELWLRNPQGVMVPAGLMPVKADQTVVLKGAAADATAVGITVEPVGGSDKPTTAPIAMFDLEAT